jgi:hypothetical protein
MSTLNDEIVEDDTFVSKATNPARRSAEIAAITKRRKIRYWFLTVVTVGFIIFGTDGIKWRQALPFLICIGWVEYLMIVSDLRLLRIIDRIQRDDKPVA